MKCHSWERIFIDTPRLYSSAHILLTEAIYSFIQKIWSDPKSSQDYQCPEDPGESRLCVTDVGETMDWCGREKLIQLPPEASHIELCIVYEPAVARSVKVIWRRA